MKLVGGKAYNIDDPNGTGGTVCLGINSSGAIVGYYVNSSNSDQGFLYQSGKFTDIPGPAGATYSDAYGINDKGEIAGQCGDSSGVTVGFLWNGS